MRQYHYLFHWLSYFFELKNTLAKPKLPFSAFYRRKSGAFLFYHGKDPNYKARPTLNFVIFQVNKAISGKTLLI